MLPSQGKTDIPQINVLVESIQDERDSPGPVRGRFVSLRRRKDLAQWPVS